MTQPELRNFILSCVYHNRKETTSLEDMQKVSALAREGFRRLQERASRN